MWFNTYYNVQPSCESASHKCDKTLQITDWKAGMFPFASRHQKFWSMVNLLHCFCAVPSQKFMEESTGLNKAACLWLAWEARRKKVAQGLEPPSRAHCSWLTSFNSMMPFNLHLFLLQKQAGLLLLTDQGRAFWIQTSSNSSVPSISLNILLKSP